MLGIKLRAWHISSECPTMSYIPRLNVAMTLHISSLHQSVLWGSCLFRLGTWITKSATDFPKFKIVISQWTRICKQALQLRRPNLQPLFAIPLLHAFPHSSQFFPNVSVVPAHDREWQGRGRQATSPVMFLPPKCYLPFNPEVTDVSLWRPNSYCSYLLEAAGDKWHKMCFCSGAHGIRCPLISEQTCPVRLSDTESTTTYPLF